MTRKTAGLGGANSAVMGVNTISPRTMARQPSIARVSLKGLEGPKLTAAVRHAAATAEARHLCFDQVKTLLLYNNIFWVVLILSWLFCFFFE